MPRITVDLPPSVSDEEAQVIADHLRRISESEWEIFKRNFNAFVDSLKNVCKAFWHKLTSWVKKIWDSIF